ncbi:hypothetical protein [Algicola sagamiensis]|uniref:hypothetical protein n=1 Tax=Algicola sagamiensis TaxID=163869 RepID=UPI0003A614BE|nr:hypothetical protein [Algicola sagamiensis]
MSATLKTIGVTALASLILSPLASADTYKISADSGLTDIYSSTINKTINVNPNPSGVESGTIEIDINTSTGAITMGGEDDIVLGDFNASVNFLGLTTWHAVATGVSFNQSATGTLDAMGKATLTSGDGDPAIYVNTDFQGCSGLACRVIMNADLDAKNYTVEIDFSDDYSSFTSTAVGYTSNGTKMTLVLNGVKQ